ncbi:hypothetical protein M9H77_26356 [Catharanthus roseus]|uniref:Uncharacterized protein n=1 Tax=Catharanthus roseus TaxID=4058 RepID=A0ACC0ADP7_CATRO|nr:hypothetical protein M9H77_26356 [Catharanthus roseus]
MVVINYVATIFLYDSWTKEHEGKFIGCLALRLINSQRHPTFYSLAFRGLGVPILADSVVGASCVRTAGDAAYTAYHIIKALDYSPGKSSNMYYSQSVGCRYSQASQCLKLPQKGFPLWRDPILLIDSWTREDEEGIKLLKGVVSIAGGIWDACQAKNIV